MDAGGLVVLSWAPHNPWTGHFVGDTSGVNIPDLLTPGTVANLRFTGWMDTIASEIALFGPDRPVIFRPFSEMNGGWDWYGHLTQADFIMLWRWMRDYFVQTKGLHHILWTYECHTQAHQPVSLFNAGYSMDYCWPGDDVVDMVGFSVYTHNWDASFDSDAQSRLHPKAFAITEGGPEKTDGLVANDYNSRYVPQCLAKYPRSAFFIIWNSFPVWNQQTQTSSYNHLAIVDNPNYVALLTDPHVVNRDAVFWRSPPNLAAGATSSSQIGLSWTPVSGATGYRVEMSADGVHAWTPVSSPSAPGATVGGFAPSSTLFFRVRAIYPDGDSDAGDVQSASTLTPVQGWCLINLGDPNASLLGDADHDGLADLMEYACGSSPLVATSGLPVQGSVKAGAADCLTLAFTRDPAAVEVTLTVQWSTDLLVWNDGSSYGPGGIVPANGFTTELSRSSGGSGGLETITVRSNVPMGAGSQFLRVKAGM